MSAMQFDNDDPVVYHSWLATIGDAHSDWYRELLTRYGEPHRRYHTIAHLRHFITVARDHVPSDFCNNEFTFAALLHDIIYDTSLNDNEERSAELAMQWWHNDIVRDLIIATKRHEPLQGNLHELSCYFLDCDMAILGTPQEVYDQYARAIREEYSNYDDATYKAGRAQFLRKTLERDSIFLTEPFKKAYEAIARENLAWELGMMVRGSIV